MEQVKRGKGRPPTGVKIEVRVPADMLADLDAWATEVVVSRPELIRRILAAALAPETPTAPPTEAEGAEGR